MNYLLIILYGDNVKPGLILWVEGYHDVLFFDKIVKPNLKNKYNNITIKEHSEENRDYINRYITSITSMNIDYMFIVDIDFKSDISSKKKEIKKSYPKIEEDKILVVIKEIEGWYAAGLKQGMRKFKISNLNNTDNLTKEEFDCKIPSKYTKLEYLMEILDIFSVDIALQKNTSFRYYHNNYLD